MNPALIHRNLGNVVAIFLIAGFLLHLVIDDADTIHRKIFGPSIDQPDVICPRHTVYQITAYKTECTDIFPVSGPDFPVFTGLQVHQMQHSGLIDGAFLPCDTLFITADRKGSFRQRVCHHHILTAVHVNAINCVIYIQIQHSSCSLAGQAVKVRLQLLIGTGIRNEIALLQRIFRCHIVISGNSILSLVISTVHIAIYKKIHIPVIFYRKNSDIMVVIIAAHIRAVIIPEGKDFYGAPVRRVIAP